MRRILGFISSIVSFSLVSCLVAALMMEKTSAQPVSSVPLTTFTNPTPAVFEQFGVAITAVGKDRLLVGAYFDSIGRSQIEASYLFDTNGFLLTVFTNPTPSIAESFGSSVAAFGPDRVLIGAFQDLMSSINAGSVYMFNTNGTLLTAFTNPTPAANDLFGNAITTAGQDHVLIGARGDFTGTVAAGAAYLFTTNGVLITTFTNPTPASIDQFGFSVAALGRDRVIIGARLDDTGATDAGAGYIFSTNGTLLMTFISPESSSGDNFGRSIAALSSDVLLFGAPGSDAGSTDSGTVHAFNTNGAWVMTFTNPAPAFGKAFGDSIAVIGVDRVLIGAGGNGTESPNSGAVFLFSTNGQLLATFVNPTPASGDGFGRSVAALDSHRVFIAAEMASIGAPLAGAAHLFAIPYPALQIARNAAAASIKWVSPDSRLVLQQSESIGALASWSNVSETISVDGMTNSVLQTIPAVNNNRFFRLSRP